MKKLVFFSLALVLILMSGCGDYVSYKYFSNDSQKRGTMLFKKSAGILYVYNKNSILIKELTIPPEISWRYDIDDRLNEGCDSFCYDAKFVNSHIIRKKPNLLSMPDFEQTYLYNVSTFDRKTLSFIPVVLTEKKIKNGLPTKLWVIIFFLLWILYGAARQNYGFLDSIGLGIFISYILFFIFSPKTSEINLHEILKLSGIRLLIFFTIFIIVDIAWNLSGLQHSLEEDS